MKGGNVYRQYDGPLLTPVDAENEHVFTADPIDEREMVFVDYWRVVKRFRWSILAIALIAGIIGVLNALSATSLYQANARLLVKFNQPNISNVQQFEPTPLHWLFFETQGDIIKSRAVAERVVARLGLDKIALLAPQRGDAESPAEPTLRQRLRGWFSDFKSWMPEEFRPPERPPLDAQARQAALVGSVLGAVSVSGGKESEVLIVSVVSADPEMAADMANAFAQEYIAFGLDSRATNVQQATSWLGQRIEELRHQVSASEKSLREFQAREDLVDTTNREKIISAKLGTLTAELIKAQSRRSEAEARYSQVTALLENGDADESLVTIINNAMVLDAHRVKVSQEQRVSELSERYGHKHPKMIAAEADLQDAERRLKAEIDKSANNIRKELDLAAAQESRFREMIARQQTEMRKVSGKGFKLKQLEREVEANRQLYETFLARFKEADIADEYNVSNARIIDRAIVPITPFKPNRKRMVMIAVVMGLGIGVLVAFLRNHLDNTFKTKEDVENFLKLPVIGMLPKIRSRPLGKSEPERLVLSEPRSPFAEAINDIRTAILFSRIDTPPKVVLITSPLPGEGKTTLALNLALAFSRRGRTLLIDADLRKGRLEELLHLNNHPGLTDMLSGQCTADEAIVADHEAENLFLLTAGTLPPNPLEVISSQRFSDELGKLRNGFEHIVIDGTPLLPVSDSIVLARIVDVTVMTVKSDDTARDVALEALKRTQASRIKPVGVVLQQVDMRKLRGYGRRYVASYSGYYGYRKSREA
jgi:capsular exopolysaccharide synthesis family protein